MAEIVLYMHPATWLNVGLWTRIKMRLRYQVVLDRRCPPDKMYLGTKDNPITPPNGRFGRVTLSRRRTR